MGRFDSSKTRVAPVFNRLIVHDDSGWIPRLLALPARDGHHRVDWGDVGPIEEHGWWGNPSEVKLRPPPALLRQLIGVLYACGHDAADPWRRRLFEGDSEARARAINELEKRGFVDGAWYVFEGRTSVDAYIRTRDLIVLVEGKRTESAPTTVTTWMPVRHQVLRNIDAAWDERGNRRVVACFIVEGVGPEGSAVPPEWLEFANTSVSEEALSGSLPHRLPLERSEMAKGFLGVTTWQAVCDAFELPRSVLKDEAD